MLTKTGRGTVEYEDGDSDDFDRPKRRPVRFPVGFGRLWMDEPEFTAERILLSELRVAVCR